MVKTQLCTRCAGLGRIMTLDEPPEDPESRDGWESCPRCRGAGVEMASRTFEVYFVFDDEVEARAFMDSASAATASRKHGIRALGGQNSHLDESQQ